MIDLIRQRRSIRRYQARPIEPEKVALLREAVLRSPSSKGSNPWEFVFVDDRDLLSRLAESKVHGSGFLKDAALGVVVCADETKSDVWVEDSTIAAILLQVMAHSLGLGSCWIQIRRREHSTSQSAEAYIQDLLGIPLHLRVETIIALGYPAEEKTPHPGESLLQNRVHRNRYGKTD